MGEEGKAWTSLYHCSLLEKVQLQTKPTKATTFNRSFSGDPSPVWNKHGKALRASDQATSAAFLLEHGARNNQVASQVCPSCSKGKTWESSQKQAGWERSVHPAALEREKQHQWHQPSSDSRWSSPRSARCLSQRMQVCRTLHGYIYSISLQRNLRSPGHPRLQLC